MARRDRALDAERATGRRGLYEHDAEVGYERELGGFTVQAGWVNYFVPSDETARFTNDVMAGVAYGIVRRMGTLAAFLRAADDNRDFSSRLGDRHADEIGQVASAVNHLHGTIRAPQPRARAGERAGARCAG